MLVANNEYGGTTNYTCGQKEAKYFCPECGNPVRFKSGQIKIPHFAHIKKNSTCPNSKETKEHIFGKARIFQLLLASGWINVTLEKPFPSIGRRADVYAETYDEHGVKVQAVFEIQNSGMDIEEVAGRTKDYRRAGINVIWIPVFKSLDTSEEGSLTPIMPPLAYLTREFKIEDWQVLMCGYHENSILSVVKNGKESELALIHVTRATREGGDWYNRNGESGYSHGHTLANTYEGSLVFIPEEMPIPLIIKETQRKIKNDKKKWWSLEGTFGDRVFQPIFLETTSA